MIVAQLAIPLAAAVAAAFALWFALDVLLRTRPAPAVAEAARPARDLLGRFVWRLLGLGAAAGLLAGAAAGALVGFERDLEAGAIAALAVVAGAVAAALTASLGAALAQGASERAATAADRTLRQALAITLWAGAAPALASAALAIAGVAGLYGIATRFADLPAAEAALLALGVAAGAAVAALAARLLAADDVREAAGSAAASAQTFALIATAGAGGLALGEPLARLTDESAWLVAPLVALALGLGASTIAAITLPFWTRVLRNAGRAAPLGAALAVPIAGALAFAAPLALLDEGRWWFAGAALTGAALGALLVLGGRPLLRDRADTRATAAGAAFTLLAGAALVVAFVLGWQVELEGVRPTTTALYGVALAAAGALASAPIASATRWFGSGAASAVALAELARESASPPDGDGPAPLPLAPLAATAERALAPAWSHALGWTALAGAVLVAALLVAVRAQLGAVAADDIPRYTRLAADLGAVPAAEQAAAVAYDLDRYRDALARSDIPESDLPWLLLARDAEARRLIALRVEQDRADAEALALGGGPWPFPALPPLRLDGLLAAGALLGVATLLGAVGLAPGGRRWPTLRAAALLLLATAVPLGGALLARLLVGGNAGWELAAGAALAAFIAGLALAAQAGVRNAASEAGLALAVWIAASAALVAPALLPI